MSSNDFRQDDQVEEVGLTQVNPDSVTRGQEAWGRLKKSLTDWFAVAEALQYGQHRSMLASYSNEPSGRRFQTEMAGWLSSTGFHEIDKGVRSRLLDCLKHRAEVEAWHKTLPANKRQQLNHPNTVWRAWQKSTITGKATVAARSSPITKYKEEVARLEDENHRLRRNADDLFLPQDTAADIARVLVDHLTRLTPTKAKQIIQLLPGLYAERSAEVPYEKARRKPQKKRRTVEDFQRDLAAKKAAAGAHHA
jgi:hypothetical protein